MCDDASRAIYQLPRSGLIQCCLSFRPDIDSAVHFLRELLPRILAARPGMVFYAAGAA